MALIFFFLRRAPTSSLTTRFPSKWSRVVPMKVAMAPAVGQTTLEARWPSGSESAVMITSSRSGV